MTSHRTFDRSELAVFLRAVDGNLTAEAKLVVIGGGAAAIGYGVDIGTQDIDTAHADLERIEAAAARARQQTGLNIPVSYAPVADFPWNYEDRLRREMPELTRLALWVLEEHDLALSKIVRGNEHDVQQIVDLHRRRQLDVDTLVERYVNEMSHVVGDANRVRSNFLDLIEVLFGEITRVGVMRAISRP